MKCTDTTSHQATHNSMCCSKRNQNQTIGASKGKGHAHVGEMPATSTCGMNRTDWPVQHATVSSAYTGLLCQLPYQLVTTQEMGQELLVSWTPR